MKAQLTPVILVVDDHWLLGKLSTGGQRVLDILTQASTDYLKLVEVKVFRSVDRTRCIAELPEVIVPKDRMCLLLLPTKKVEVSPTKRIHAIVEKKKNRAYVIAGGLTIEGQIHVTKRVEDPVYTLARTFGHFFPITEATVSGFRSDPMPVNVVIVNKPCVSCFYCSGETSSGDKESGAAQHQHDAAPCPA